MITLAIYIFCFHVIQCTAVAFYKESVTCSFSNVSVFIIVNAETTWTKNTSLINTIEPFLLLQKIYQNYTFLKNEKSSNMFSYLLPKEFRKLFRIYTFKGYTFSVVKSLTNLPSFGLGLRIPITSNFPEYDRRSEYLKIGSFLQLVFPLDLVLSMSFSFPLNTVIYAISRMAFRLGLISPAAVKKMRKMKASSSVRRLGWTAGLRYNTRKGLRPYVGTWTNYLTNVKRADGTIGFPLEHILTHLAAATGPGSGTSPDSLLLHWLTVRSIVLGWNMGISKTSTKANIGSNVLLDVFPVSIPSLKQGQMIVVNATSAFLKMILPRTIANTSHTTFASAECFNEPNERIDKIQVCSQEVISINTVNKDIIPVPGELVGSI